MDSESNELQPTLHAQAPIDWILWVDEALIAINKPSGLRTLPDGYDPTAPHLKSLLEPIYGRLWIAHRLDKETSGVLVLARAAEVHRSLNTQFEQHEIQKTYHALVKGSMEWEEKIIDLPLCPNGDHRHRTVVDLHKGKPALTRLRVLERFKGYTLLEACPETGRTHQIRAHLSSAGFPLAGDRLYGGGEPLPPLEGFALHAKSLDLKHPLSGERLFLAADYPALFQSALKILRRSANKP